MQTSTVAALKPTGRRQRSFLQPEEPEAVASSTGRFVEDMSISLARREYVRWLRVTKELSPHTIRAYEGDIAAFERHLGTRAHIDLIHREGLMTFLEEQRAAGLGPASLRRRASGLRGFCRWLLSLDLLAAETLSGTTVAAGRSRKLPRVVPAYELERLLGFLRRNAGIDATGRPIGELVQPHESTTLLAVALMVATGVRVQEAVSIRCHDVDVPARSLRLHGKGGRERQVFMPNDWLADLMSAYLATRAALDLDHPYLLFNAQGNALSTAALRSRLAKSARDAGLSRNVTPHMLRHTAATQLIEAGVDIRFIQRLLGHASVSTTEIYTHVSNRALRQVISEADVLGRVLAHR